MKKIILSSLFFVMAAPGAIAGEIHSRITDSIQLTVEGPGVQSQRLGSSYSVSGTNISATTFGGLTAGSATAPSLISAGSYDIHTDGQAFSFTESAFTGDTAVTSQTTLSHGQFTAPNLYSDSTTSSGGSAGSLAGTLSGTSVPTITAGGAGTTGIGQRTIELTVFR